MTPAELALHYTADQLLAALCMHMDPANAVATVRAVAPFLSPEDKAARERRMRNERSRRSYHGKKSDGNQRQNPDDNQSEGPSDSNGGPSESPRKSDGVSSGQPPMVSPDPILSPPPRPAPPAHAHVRPPTLDEVLAFLASATLPIPIADRPEFAQAYLDARQRTDPPWWLPETDRKRGGPINLAPQGWQADCRTFARNWRNNDAERAARLPQFSLSASAADTPTHRLAKTNGHHHQKPAPGGRAAGTLNADRINDYAGGVIHSDT